MNAAGLSVLVLHAMYRQILLIDSFYEKSRRRPSVSHTYDDGWWWNKLKCEKLLMTLPRHDALCDIQLDVES